MVLTEYLLQKLEIFENEISNVLRLFESNFGTKNPLKLWRTDKIERVGFLDLDKSIEYSFHGAGCTIEFYSKTIVSFDFDEYGEICYTLFNLKLYLESLNEEALFDEKQLDNALISLLRDEKIIEIKDCGFRLKGNG